LNLLINSDVINFQGYIIVIPRRQPLAATLPEFSLWTTIPGPWSITNVVREESTSNSHIQDYLEL
jgi:hypothetical protein